MPPGRNAGGGRGGGGGGRGRGRGGGGRRGRGRGGRSSGRGTALPSSITGRGRGGSNGDDRRRRGGGDRGSAGYEFDDGGGAASDRHKYDDEAGDSDDGPGPDDSDFEDEEVDEDAAFDSADEARYGEIMDTILERRSEKPGGGDEEDEDESDDESDAGEGGGMTVMDMLAANEAAEEAQKNPAFTTGKGKGKGEAKGRENGGGMVEGGGTAPNSSGVSGDDASGDEGTFEGDAMDEDSSDGAEPSEEEEEEEEDSSEEEEDEEEEERHARLMGFVGTLGEQAAAAHRAAEDRRSSQLLKEGEFNATAAAATAGGVSSGGGDGGAGGRKGAITMETLMGSLQNSKGFAAVQKQVDAFSGRSGAPSAPVSKTAELRAERETAYDSRKSDMGKWVAPVQANRKAETLDFAPAVKTNLSNAALASKMEATTDMEKEVEMLLTAGGASEAGLADQEMEELKSKAYTVEEVKERQAELSKMRALMFYHERKQHHMNKIKSKVYRKIKKRQRDRAGEGQPDADGEQGEAAARKRAEERMTLRHKNTTKWVKNALRAKGGAGKDDRKAIAEQLKLGQELRAKMDGVGDNSSDDHSSSSEEEEDADKIAGGGAKASKKRKKSTLRAADREELEGIGDKDEDEDGVPTGGKGAALLKMAFMQKAMNKQRERAREEASVVLRELEEAAAAAAAEENSSDDETRANGNKNKKRKASGGGAAPSWGESDALGDGKGGAGARVSKEARAEAAAEVAQSLPPGAVQSSVVSMDATLKSSVASPITIDLGGGAGGNSGSAAAEGVETEAGSGEAQLLDASGGSAEADSVKAGAQGAKRGREAGADADGASEGMEMGSDDGDEEEEEDDDGANASNPWLVPTPRRSKDRRRASNGEVLLDVRKAAATALSAFSGASDGDKDGVGELNGGQGGVERDSGSKSSGGVGNGESSGVNGEGGAGKGGQGKKKRRKKRKRSGGGGGGGGEGEGDGAKGDGSGENSAVRAATAKEARSKEGKEAGEVTATGAAEQSVGKKKRKKRKNKSGKGKATPDEKPETSTKKKPAKAEAAAGTVANGKKKAGKAGATGPKKNKKTGKAGAAGGPASPGAAAKKKKENGGGAAASAAGSKLAGLSNDELVRRAFAAPDFDAEFKDSKDDEIEEVLSKGREKLPGSLAGWGAWAGDGAPVPQRPTKRQMLVKKVQAKKEEAIKTSRKDDRLPKVVINEKRQKRSAKYMVSEVPYPFTSREQYERSLRQPIGGEWNTSQSVRAMTRPAVVVRAGVAVAPMKLGKLHRDNAKEKSAEVAAKGAKPAEGKKTRGGAGRRRGAKAAQ